MSLLFLSGFVRYPPVPLQVTVIKQGIKDARENKRGKLSMHFLERAKYLQDSADRMWAFFGKVRKERERARAREREKGEREKEPTLL